MSVINKMRDGLENIMTGLGMEKSKRAHNKFAYGASVDFGQLDAAYQDNWIAGKIVDTPAKDMTREWRRIKAKDSEVITALEKKLTVQSIVQEAITWARLYGGAGVVMVTNQSLDKPLNVNTIKKGDLKRLLVFDRFDLTADNLESTDVLSPNFLKPEYYRVRGGGQKIHWSHIARFEGAKLPLRHQMMVQGWGDSILRKCIDDIADTVAAKDGIAELMQEANIDVISVEGLQEQLASGEDSQIIDRYAQFSQMKSVINMALLDSGEKLDRLTLNLSGVAPIIEQLMTWISGAASIPVTKLFGTSAKGMNATGEGDLKNYYDDIRSSQLLLEVPLSVIDEVMVRSALGDMPDDYDYIWNPLAQSNEVETEQAALLRAQKSVTYIDSGIITKSQVQRELQSNEEFQFSEGEIEVLEKLEDPDLFEAGMGGGVRARE